MPDKDSTSELLIKISQALKIEAKIFSVLSQSHMSTKYPENSFNARREFFK